MIHKDQIDGYEGSPADLVEAIGNLKYDALANFLALLAAKIEQDGQNDCRRGRVQLAASLENCTSHLEKAKLAIDKPSKISAPYMK